MKSSIEYIAKVLRTDKDNIIKIDKRLSEITGRGGVIDKIVEENAKQVETHLSTLGLSRGVGAKEVYDALISKIEADAHSLFVALGKPRCDVKEECNKVLERTRKTVENTSGFFLKKEKAVEFLKKEPPKKVLSYLGYSSVDEMLAKEDLLEVYSALRFIEDGNWMNDVFFKQYEDLTPDDFEEREIIVKALDLKWIDVAEKFVFKKWHNISHLKELGVVFVIPITLGISGELLRMISLVLHYLYEITFYSEMFKKSAEVPSLFAENIISLLRGDVVDRRFPESEKTLWLVIQRYLAKDDENDWRLFVPRINPEAYHWLKAEESLVRMGDQINHFGGDLKFWCGLDWVGDYFRDEAGNDILVSFDLVDTVMSLIKRKELIKYLYHHQEALWNKIFTEYFGRDQLDYFLKEYLLQGYFEI